VGKARKMASYVEEVGERKESWRTGMDNHSHPDTLQVNIFDVVI
jgi:hypothetical protein